MRVAPRVLGNCAQRGAKPGAKDVDEPLDLLVISREERIHERAQLLLRVVLGAIHRPTVAAAAAANVAAANVAAAVAVAAVIAAQDGAWAERHPERPSAILSVPERHPERPSAILSVRGAAEAAEHECLLGASLSAARVGVSALPPPVRDRLEQRAHGLTGLQQQRQGALRKQLMQQRHQTR